jgi:hypothetical protein
MCYPYRPFSHDQVVVRGIDASKDSASRILWPYQLTLDNVASAAYRLGDSSDAEHQGKNTPLVPNLQYSHVVASAFYGQSSRVGRQVDDRRQSRAPGLRPQRPAPHATCRRRRCANFSLLLRRITSTLRNDCFGEAANFQLSGKWVNDLQIILRTCDRLWSAPRFCGEFGVTGFRQ